MQKLLLMVECTKVTYHRKIIFKKKIKIIQTRRACFAFEGLPRFSDQTLYSRLPVEPIYLFFVDARKVQLLALNSSMNYNVFRATITKSTVCSARVKLAFATRVYTTLAKARVVILVHDRQLHSHAA